MDIMETAEKKREENEETPVAEDVDIVIRELGERLWAVISFEKREAGALTYGEAAQKVAELEAAGVAGLCIITDEAAARLADRD